MARLRCDCGEALTAECELPESQSIAGLLSLAFSTETLAAGDSPMDLKRRMGALGQKALTWNDLVNLPALA